MRTFSAMWNAPFEFVMGSPKMPAIVGRQIFRRTEQLAEAQNNDSTGRIHTHPYNGVRIIGALKLYEARYENDGTISD